MDTQYCIFFRKSSPAICGSVFWVSGAAASEVLHKCLCLPTCWALPLRVGTHAACAFIHDGIYP